MNFAKTLEYIQKNEGFLPFVYSDKTAKRFVSPPNSGKLTIGYGTNLEDRGLTKEESAYLCGNDIKTIHGKLAFTYRAYLKLDDYRQMALIDLAYNLGMKGLMAFIKTLILLGEKKYEAAAQELMNSAYAKQLPLRAERNKWLIAHGDWPPLALWE